MRWYVRGGLNKGRTSRTCSLRMVSPPWYPSGCRSSRMRTTGSRGSSFSRRCTSSVKGSSFEGRRGREYFGGSALRIARRMVLRWTPKRRASSRIPTFSMKCSRRISAHCSTFSTPFPPSRWCAPPRPGWTTSTLSVHDGVGHYSSAARGAVFKRRGHGRRVPASGGLRRQSGWGCRVSDPKHFDSTRHSGRHTPQEAILVLECRRSCDGKFNDSSKPTV